MNKEAEILLSLSETDKELVGFLTRQEALVCRKEAITSELDQCKQELETLEADLKQGASRQALEEHRLRDEQQKIMDRRKQLTAIGGAKVAKMVEREIDIASRTLESMEQNAIRAIEEVDTLNNRIVELRTRIAELEEQLSSQGPEMDIELQEIEGHLSELGAARAAKFDDIEPRLRHLYNRVQGRYPDSPVAVAKKCACRSCFRALPNQTYNQILAGNSLIQCPGCQRILVYLGEDVEPN